MGIGVRRREHDQGRSGRAQRKGFNKRGGAVGYALTDEAFGQRHFITADPNGVLIDVITPIPPSAEFAAAYAPEALPG